MPSWRTSASSPKSFLLCGRHRLKETMWWVPNQRSFKTVYVPSGKLTGWLARLWLSPRSIESPRPARKWRHPTRRLLELQSLTAWGPRPPQLRGLWLRSRPFELAPEGPVHDHSKEARSLARLLRLPLPDNVDGSQVGARLADFAPHWRNLLGNCRATGIVEDGVGIAFQQRPQLTHQSIIFRTRNSCQDLQQVVDDLLMKGAIERVSNVTRLMWCLPSCSDASGCPQVSAFRGRQGVPVHLSSVWTEDLSTRVHQAAANRVSLFRQQGVKLHVYLDDWLIRADTPEQAQLQAQTTFRVLQFLARSSTSRSPISHQDTTSSSLGFSSTLDVSQWRPTEDASKGPVSSSALDDQSEHHGQRFAQTSRHAGVHGLRWSGEDGSVFVQSNSHGYESRMHWHMSMHPSRWTTQAVASATRLISHIMYIDLWSWCQYFVNNNWGNVHDGWFWKHWYLVDAREEKHFWARCIDVQFEMHWHQFIPNVGMHWQWSCRYCKYFIQLN